MNQLYVYLCPLPLGPPSHYPPSHPSSFKGKKIISSFQGLSPNSGMELYFFLSIRVSCYQFNLPRTSHFPVLLNWTQVHSPDAQQSQSTDILLWWRKIECLFAGHQARSLGLLSISWQLSFLGALQINKLMVLHHNLLSVDWLCTCWWEELSLVW